MSEESMTWLGVALWLKDLGYTTEQAAKAAGPVSEAFARATGGSWRLYEVIEAPEEAGVDSHVRTEATR